MSLISDKTIKRFWSKTRPRRNGCIEWLASKSHNGYGQFGVNGKKNVRAHRFSWTIVNGDIPEGLCVLHKCDNPSCVNPEHLFLGTYKDNAIDMTLKGRRYEVLTKGDDNGNSKLNKRDINKMKILYSTGFYTQKYLADMFGITRSWACGILNDKARAK